MTGSPPLDEALAWSVASVRLVIFFLVAPVFGYSALPSRVRVAFAMAVTLALAPVVPMPETGGLLSLGGVVAGEVLLGLALGFAARLLFAAFDLLGEFVSIQGGLGAAQVVDPASGSSSVALASTFGVFTLLIFLAIDGHHALLRAVAESYARVPVGAGGPSESAFLAVAGLGASIFELAVRLAAPFTIAMFVSNVAVGILGRVIPQLNLMMLQLPAHVALTLALLALGAGVIVRASSDELLRWPEIAFAAAIEGG